MSEPLRKRLVVAVRRAGRALTPPGNRIPLDESLGEKPPGDHTPSEASLRTRTGAGPGYN